LNLTISKPHPKGLVVAATETSVPPFGLEKAPACWRHRLRYLHRKIRAGEAADVLNVFINKAKLIRSRTSISAWRL
jgi:hypothetical protein